MTGTGASMATDIFQFWSGIRLKGGAHPADCEVLRRVDHNFDLRCLPRPFSGPLKTAPVVLLFLSHRLSEQDYSDAKSRSGRDRYRRTWGGKESLWGPKDHESAWRWWKSRTACFGDWQDLQTKVAILNIGAYHSETFADWPLLAALPSSRVSIDWAQHVLFLEAMAGQRVVVCLRSAEFWGLKKGKRYGKALFAPAVTRRGDMKLGRERNAIIREVKAALVR